MGKGSKIVLNADEWRGKNKKLLNKMKFNQRKFSRGFPDALGKMKHLQEIPNVIYLFLPLDSPVLAAGKLSGNSVKSSKSDYKPVWNSILMQLKEMLARCFPARRSEATAESSILCRRRMSKRRNSQDDEWCLENKYFSIKRIFHPNDGFFIACHPSFLAFWCCLLKKWNIDQRNRESEDILFLNNESRHLQMRHITLKHMF